MPSNLVPKEYEDGIYVFTDGSNEVGSDAVHALALDSAITELDITANRSHALSTRCSGNRNGARENWKYT